MIKPVFQAKPSTAKMYAKLDSEGNILAGPRTHQGPLYLREDFHTHKEWKFACQKKDPDWVQIRPFTFTGFIQYTNRASYGHLRFTHGDHLTPLYMANTSINQFLLAVNTGSIIFSARGYYGTYFVYKDGKQLLMRPSLNSMKRVTY